MTEKKLISLRISPDAKHLLEVLSSTLGISQTAVFEMAIRKLAIQEKLEKKPKP